MVNFMYADKLEKTNDTEKEEAVDVNRMLYQAAELVQGWAGQLHLLRELSTVVRESDLKLNQDFLSKVLTYESSVAYDFVKDYGISTDPGIALSALAGNLMKVNSDFPYRGFYFNAAGSYGDDNRLCHVSNRYMDCMMNMQAIVDILEARPDALKKELVSPLSLAAKSMMSNTADARAIVDKMQNASTVKKMFNIFSKPYESDAYKFYTLAEKLVGAADLSIVQKTLSVVKAAPSV